MACAIQFPTTVWISPRWPAWRIVMAEAISPLSRDPLWVLLLPREDNQRGNCLQFPDHRSYRLRRHWLCNSSRLERMWNRRHSSRNCRCSRRYHMPCRRSPGCRPKDIANRQHRCIRGFPRRGSQDRGGIGPRRFLYRGHCRCHHKFLAVDTGTRLRSFRPVQEHGFPHRHSQPYWTPRCRRGLSVSGFQFQLR